MEKSGSHFLLVHGACHGAWCWYKISAILKSKGHKVTALDMAASGIHPKQAHEVHSLSHYIEPLVEFMASLPPEERVILVGHSMGGAWISAAMESFPERISVAVYATAVMPGPHLSLSTISEEVCASLSLSRHTSAAPPHKSLAAKNHNLVNSNSSLCSGQGWYIPFVINDSLSLPEFCLYILITNTDRPCLRNIWRDWISSVKTY